MTDHLEEARGYIRANTGTGFLVPDQVEANMAIVHALIAIAERLQPQSGVVEQCGDRLGHAIGGGTSFCARGSGHSMPHRSPDGVEWFLAPDETVPELLPEHRDRVWRDKDGESWRWRIEAWEVNSPEVGWCVAAEGHRSSNYRIFGPFTAVPS